MNTIAIRAGWLIPVSVPPLHEGWLVAHRGRIVHLGLSLPDRFLSCPKVELPNVAILPGFFNAHTHTEFSDLSAPIPYRGSFIGWIRDVVQHRRASMKTNDPTSRREAVVRGIQNAYDSGTRYMLDTITAPWEPSWVTDRIATLETGTPWSEALIEEAPFLYHPCPEVLDIQESRRNETDSFLEGVMRKVETAQSPIFDTKFAVSPHAPYTTSLALVEEMTNRAKHFEGIVSMHLAESMEEWNWLMHRSEPIESALASFRDAEFIQHFRQDVSGVEGTNRIDRYLDELIKAPLGLIAHGNYFSQENLQRIAAASSTAAIVHCPRTYRHFHAADVYPLRERLALGVTHLLGTDSCASSPDLDLWKDARELARYYPELREEIVRMLTQIPARMLGLVDLGELKVGAKSLCTAVTISEGEGCVFGKLFEDSTVAKPLEIFV